MDNIWKFVLIALGGIVTIFIAIKIFDVFSEQSDTIDAVSEQSSEFTTQMTESLYTQYDGVTIKGSEVINVIKKMKSDVICIKVNNGKQETEYLYNAALTTDLTGDLTDMLKEARNKQNMNKYINPNASFEGEVIRDPDTDTIIGITFTKQ